MSTHKKGGEGKKSEADLVRDARERIVRQAELALIQLNDEMQAKGPGNTKAPMHTQDEYLILRRRITLAANLTEEDLMQRLVFAAGKGGFAPDVDRTLTWDGLERHRDGTERKEAMERGEVTTRSLASALKDHLTGLKRPPGERGPVAGAGAQAPRVVITIEQQLSILENQERMGAITPAQHEVRSHEARQGKVWSVEQRGRIETALSHLLEASIRGEVSEEDYDRQRKALLDGGPT